MSIINQTLRDLDARKAGAGSHQVPLRPVVASFRRRPGSWSVGVLLLLIAGMAAWHMPWPAETIPQRQAGSAQRAAMPQAAIQVPSTPVAPPVELSAPKPASDRPEIAAAVSLDEPLGLDKPVQPQPQPDSGKVTKLSGLSLEMRLSTSVESHPAIRKEVNNPSVDEEADERYRKAVVLVQKGRENQARPLLEEAIRLSSRHVAARQMLATLLSEAGQNREAEAVLREARVAIPDNAWFALGLARMQASRGDVEGAVATLQNGLEGRGVNAEYRAMLAALLVRLKQYPEAARQYEQALKLQPDQGTWWMGLGLSMEALGKADEARSAYGRALAAGNLPEKLVEFVRIKLAE